LFKGLKDDWYKRDNFGEIPPFLRKPPAGNDCILMVYQRIPLPGKSGEFKQFNAILTILLDLGYKITLISRLKKLKYLEIYDHKNNFTIFKEYLNDKEVSIFYGVDVVNTHLLEEGYKYKCAILLNVEAAFDFNPLIRAYAINAEVLYVAGDLKLISKANEEAIKIGTAIQNNDDPIIKMAHINIECSDRVIVMSEMEKELILSLLPGKIIDVFSPTDSFGHFIKK
jgi:hypothetical protein